MRKKLIWNFYFGFKSKTGLRAMPSWNVTATTILMIFLGGVIKAHLHFVRLALLAIIGLLGLYLLHRLAQDYNRLVASSSGGSGGGGGGGGGGGARPPRFTSVLGLAARLFRSSISKRSVDSQLMDVSLENLVSKFTSVLFFDPIGCARKFMCYSASKPVANLTESERNLLQLFQLKKQTNNAFDQFRDAVKLGSHAKNTTLCEKKYKACYLSSKQLFTFYNFF